MGKLKNMSNIRTMSKIEDSYALSPMQQGMLFQYQLAPDAGYYVQQLVGSFHEDIDVDAFRKAWERIILRYSILRTAFRWEDLEEPLQEVYEKVGLPFEMHDWRGLSAARQQERFEEFLKADRKKGFNLAEAPVLRLTFFRLAEEDYRFVWSYHHIIIDGMSRRVMMGELTETYDAIRQGTEPVLPPAVPYRKYIEWFRQQDISGSEGFWRTLLKDFRTPTAISAPLTTGGERDREKVEGEARLSESVTSMLRNLARENGMTLNTIVQGAWALLLGRYSGEEDVVFGVVRAGRHWTLEKGNKVGLFIYTVPTRIRVPSKAPLLPWLGEIRQQIVDVRQHEATPLIDIQRWSGVPSGRSLFDSLFVFYEKGTSFWSKEAGWQKREYNLIEDNGFPITLDAYGEPDLLLKATCERQDFDKAAVNRMAGHLKTLLESMAENPHRTLSELPMLTDAERQEILVKWNETGKDYPQDKLIHQVFETQAEKTPDAIAVVFEGQTLTYRELNERASQLAHYLKSLGVGPEKMVGIAVERSLEMIVGLYGILKAGGAYVPLDPTYPPDRIAYMMQDAGVPVLLTQRRLLENLPESSARVVCLDSDWDSLIASQSRESPACEATLDNLAYVIYTSGSTGRPKGAMNTHAGILNRLFWMQDAYRLTADDAVLQKTPFSFDVSVWEFFWPLMFGARLVVARPEGHKDADYLVNTIIEQKITTMHFVPSMLQIFLMARDVEKCASLRQVICSGEALPLELQNRFFARLNARLHNLYGPTEAAVDVTYWECRKDSGLKTVPIGRPVANTQMYILDRGLQPVPVGIAGELYIGGVQVGRGYWNRPELTAEKFIPDPFSKNPEARLYKTGDSCRYLPDGNIEYLGRLDFQVKIRGNRIELGEIEALLGQHPAVHEAVVTAREDTPGDMRLAAYLVLDRNREVNAGELRDYVRQKLPDFMVPSYFVVLDKLPLSPNGKVDRKALPAPDKEKVKSEAAYIAPESELQKTIAGIWQQVLNVPKVGMNDNFFELGGHSLLLVRVYYKLCDAINKKLSLTDLFKYPTVGTLAGYLSGGGDEKEAAAAQVGVKRADARRAAIEQRRQAKQNIR